MRTRLIDSGEGRSRNRCSPVTQLPLMNWLASATALTRLGKEQVIGYAARSVVTARERIDLRYERQRATFPKRIIENVVKSVPFLRSSTPTNERRSLSFGHLKSLSVRMSTMNPPCSQMRRIAWRLEDAYLKIQASARAGLNGARELNWKRTARQNFALRLNAQVNYSR